ncbi:MAG TPA: hypothetical protein VMU83_00805 [Hanamia sp.]|nr:hypothetical protein [Hanamia sp.]
MDKKIAAEILKHCDNTELHRFIIDYALKNSEFAKAFTARFNPEKKSSKSKEGYVTAIEKAFHKNMNRVGNRYNGWDDFGFDAYAVAQALNPLLEKIDFYLRNNNVGEAILICQALIETLPDEWNDVGEGDEEGDVQVVYDTAIDKLQELLEENRLSKTQKEALFDWYSKEHKLTAKHEYVGLNTALGVLENYFTDTPEMLQQSLANIEERISNAGSDYRREDAAMSKICLLQKAGMEEEAERAVTEYIRFQNVRKLRLQKLIKEKRYAVAIELIQAGIKIATQEGHPGTVISWKEELLIIYKLQKNSDKILSASEELFYERRGSRKYYEELKKYTPQKDWPATLERLLSKMDNCFFGFSDLKADMLIEHKMWDRLFALCKKSGAEKLEEYEKYLKPLYAKEIFDEYQNYVEKQALITDQNAYDNVGRVLKKMKGFEGGEVVVTQLVQKYRGLYKKRRNMMKVLEGV